MRVFAIPVLRLSEGHTLRGAHIAWEPLMIMFASFLTKVSDWLFNTLRFVVDLFQTFCNNILA